ncbi:MAG: serine hydrolase [Bacillota bacterium]
MKMYLTVILVLIFCFINISVLAETFEMEILKKLFIFQKSQLRYLFSKSFLEQVSVDQIKSVIDEYSSKLGDLNMVEKTEDGYLLIFENGTAPAQIEINDANMISSLWFGSYSLVSDDSADILAEFRELSGDVSVSVIKNNSEKITAYRDQQKMAVGSAFKLHILKTLYREIENSKKSWDDIIELNEENRSLPTGILQDWPVGTPVTLKTLSTLMISQSDNTATDHIIDYLGRDKIEAGLSEENIPFLKTREFFILKFSSDKELQNRYIKASLEEKRRIIKELSIDNLENIKVGNKPVLIDKLEWYFSTEELARLIYQLKNTEEIKINSGLVQKRNYYLAGYKGGSEPGVLSFTHILQKTSENDIYAVSVTINNTDRTINKEKVAQLVSRLIDSAVKNQ